MYLPKEGGKDDAHEGIVVASTHSRDQEEFNLRIMAKQRLEPKSTRRVKQLASLLCHAGTLLVGLQNTAR